MEALEMVGLIILAFIIGYVMAGILFRGVYKKDADRWKNEASEWRKQVDDELTRP